MSAANLHKCEAVVEARAYAAHFKGGVQNVGRCTHRFTHVSCIHGNHWMTCTNQKCNRTSFHVTWHVEVYLCRGPEVQEKLHRPFNFTLKLCRKRRVLKHLWVHQWLRCAIPDSQQPTSPIGFLFLKLPPPPCAVLLVYHEILRYKNHQKCNQFIQIVCRSFGDYILWYFTIQQSSKNIIPKKIEKCFSRSSR